MNIILLLFMAIILETQTRDFEFRRTKRMITTVVLGIKIHQTSSNLFSSRQQKTYHDAVVDQVIDPMKKIGFTEDEAWKVVIELGLGGIPDLKSSLFASMDALTQSGSLSMHESFPKVLQFWNSKALVITDAVMKNPKMISYAQYKLVGYFVPDTIRFGIDTLTGKGVQTANFLANIKTRTRASKEYRDHRCTRRVRGERHREFYLNT